MGLKLIGSEGKYVAEDQNDTSLRFTDVLFGFAIREVVLRAAKWNDLTTSAQTHLVLAAVVVLGSYIGFRNSLKRGKFRLRFFNIPTLRFALDQMMVFLYFRLATFFDIPAASAAALPSDSTLAQVGAQSLFWIFVLYLLWDLLSHWMAGTGKYFDPPLEEGGPDRPFKADTYRTVITAVALALSAAVWLWTGTVLQSDLAFIAQIALIAIAVLYRFLKDSTIWE